MVLRALVRSTFFVVTVGVFSGTKGMKRVCIMIMYHEGNRRYTGYDREMGEKDYG